MNPAAGADRPRVLLVVLDGWGHSPHTRGNAFAAANAPNLKGWLKTEPHALLEASGRAVGLPQGQMGNSEVGHLTLGAGRMVHQSLSRIDIAIEDGSFALNAVLLEAIERSRGHRLHLVGLVSNGGVHSHIDHLVALLHLARARGVGDAAVHAILDGRDTPPKSAATFLATLEAALKETGVGRIATAAGRYYAMDRDGRWERAKQYHDCLVGAVGAKALDALTALTDSYALGETDEFVRPTVLGDATPLADGDVVLIFNFRPDRARQITRALAEPDFKEFERISSPRVGVYTMARYDETFPLKAAFPPEPLANILGGVLSERGLHQLRIAETEKYAHVTYFFNGMQETPFEREERVLVPSQRIATYDLRPEMSAREITRELLDRLASADFDFVLANYANPDMVGHTGRFDAAVKAVEAVDDCVGQIVEVARAGGYHVLVTADHGNVEVMIDEVGGPHTAHTTNRVPIIYVGTRSARLRDGAHSDVAPTVLDLLGLTAPREMTGKSLLH